MVVVREIKTLARILPSISPTKLHSKYRPIWLITKWQRSLRQWGVSVVAFPNSHSIHLQPLWKMENILRAALKFLVETNLRRGRTSRPRLRPLLPKALCPGKGSRTRRSGSPWSTVRSMFPLTLFPTRQSVHPHTRSKLPTAQLPRPPEAEVRAMLLACNSISSSRLLRHLGWPLLL